MTRLLLVKLADIGDLVTATPAIAAAVDSGRDITVLTTPHAAPLLAGLAGRVEVIEFPKADFDSLRGALSAAAVGRAARLWGRLRAGRFDEVAVLHHLTTGAGAAKYRLLAAATGASRVAGLDNGRGGFLDRPVPDAGFGAHPESEYWSRVVAALGIAVPAQAVPRLWLDPVDFARGAARAEAYAAGFVAIHAGTGAAAPARLWPARHWAALVASMRSEHALPVVLVGGPADVAATEAVLRLIPEQTDVLGIPGLGPGTVSLGEMAGFLAGARLFAGADSGLLHVAAATGVPLVGLYGPTDPGAWAPTGAQLTVLRSPVACSPCLYQAGRPPMRIACQRPFCMDAIEAARVTAALPLSTGRRRRAAAGAT